MDPDKDRVRPLALWCPDVEVQAVFALRDAGFAGLHGGCGELGRVAGAGPPTRGLWRPEAERTDWWLSEWDTAEDIDAVFRRALEVAKGGAHDHRGGTLGKAEAGARSRECRVGEEGAASQHRVSPRPPGRRALPPKLRARSPPTWSLGRRGG